jgi:hypothetical protein
MEIMIMKSANLGKASGCIIWILSFGLVSLCLGPLAIIVGAISSTAGAESVADIIGPYLCPEDSTAEIITFQTTTTDEFGTESPATGYEMQCVDAVGNIVRESSPDYAFYWVGLLSLGSLILSGGTAVLVAAPLSTFLRRRRSRSTSDNNV